MTVTHQKFLCILSTWWVWTCWLSMVGWDHRTSSKIYEQKWQVSLIDWAGLTVSRDLSFPSDTAVKRWLFHQPESLKLQKRASLSVYCCSTTTLPGEAKKPKKQKANKKTSNLCGFKLLKWRDCLLPQHELTIETKRYVGVSEVPKGIVWLCFLWHRKCISFSLDA